MDVLESALFLNDCYLTAATSFWTCVAVMTAAVGFFWRIIAVGSRPRHKSNASCRDQTPALQTTPSPPPPPPPPPPVLQPTPAVISRSPDDGVLTKGKFTVYYEDDGVEDGGDDGGLDGVVSVWEMCDYRIRLPVVRRVDLGWYQCQDLTVLNGSVVRLWECEGRKTSPLKRV